MNSNHTKGIWAYYHEGKNASGRPIDFKIIVKEPEKYDAEVDIADLYNMLYLGETEANAKLIVAAPDLLQALIDIDMELPDKLKLPITQKIREIARAAIRKATE